MSEGFTKRGLNRKISGHKCQPFADLIYTNVLVGKAKRVLLTLRPGMFIGKIKHKVHHVGNAYLKNNLGGVVGQCVGQFHNGKNV